MLLSFLIFGLHLGKSQAISNEDFETLLKDLSFPNETRFGDCLPETTTPISTEVTTPELPSTSDSTVATSPAVTTPPTSSPLSNADFEELMKSLSFPNETRFGECLPETTTSMSTTVSTTESSVPTTTSALSSSPTTEMTEELTTVATTESSTSSSSGRTIFEPSTGSTDSVTSSTATTESATSPSTTSDVSTNGGSSTVQSSLPEEIETSTPVLDSSTAVTTASSTMPPSTLGTTIQATSEALSTISSTEESSPMTTGIQTSEITPDQESTHFASTTSLLPTGEESTTFESTVVTTDTPNVDDSTLSQSTEEVLWSTGETTSGSTMTSSEFDSSTLVESTEVSLSTARSTDDFSLTSAPTAEATTEEESSAEMSRSGLISTSGSDLEETSIGVESSMETSAMSTEEKSTEATSQETTGQPLTTSQSTTNLLSSTEPIQMTDSTTTAGILTTTSTPSTAPLETASSSSSSTSSSASTIEDTKVEDPVTTAKSEPSTFDLTAVSSTASLETSAETDISKTTPKILIDVEMTERTTSEGKETTSTVGESLTAIELEATAKETTSGSLTTDRETSAASGENTEITPDSEVFSTPPISKAVEENLPGIEVKSPMDDLLKKLSMTLNNGEDLHNPVNHQPVETQATASENGQKKDFVIKQPAMDLETADIGAIVESSTVFSATSHVVKDIGEVDNSSSLSSTMTQTSPSYTIVSSEEMEGKQQEDASTSVDLSTEREPMAASYSHSDNEHGSDLERDPPSTSGHTVASTATSTAVLAASSSPNGLVPAVQNSGSLFSIESNNILPSRAQRPKAYGLGCPEKCPSWSLPGTDGCYVMVPPFYSRSYESSHSWCMRNKTGHMVEEDELLVDYQLIKKWIDGMELLNSSVYISHVPFIKIGYKSYGLYVTLDENNAVQLETKTVDLFGSVYYRGVCRIPQYCGLYNCSQAALYESLPGQLPLPMGPVVRSGQGLSLPCNSPSATILSLKCDSYGMFLPRPGTTSCKLPRSFKPETGTPDNKALRKQCDCNPSGTETCQQVGELFQCKCKPNWTSPDMCWVPQEAEDKCGSHGKCRPLADTFTCLCSYGYGGELCQYDLSNVTWFGGPESIGIMTPGVIMTVVLLIPEGVRLGLKAAAKYSPSPYSSTSSDDSLEYIHNWRKFTVGTVGVLVVLYGTPSWLEGCRLSCRLAFGAINILMMIVLWFLVVEAYVVLCFYSGIGRNRWDWESEPGDENLWWKMGKPQKRWYLRREVVCLPAIAAFILLQFGFGYFYYNEMTSAHTCLGQIVELSNTVTVANLSIMAVLAYLSTGLGILIQIVKRTYPENLAEQRRYFEVYQGGEGVENMDKVIRCEYQHLVQGPIIFCTYFIQVWSQYRVAYSVEGDFFSRLAFIFTILGLFLSFWDFITFQPSAYSWVMKRFYHWAPWLPIWTQFTPFTSGYLSHEEILNLKTPEYILPANKNWPLRPADEHYISIERRHQCQRKMTRHYLELKLKGVDKKQAMDMIADDFLLSLADGAPEKEQWLLVLKKWLDDIEKYDRIEFKIPRSRPMDIKDYATRVMSASLFYPANIWKENDLWCRMELVYRLMGHYPVQSTSWTKFTTENASATVREDIDKFPELMNFPAARRYLPTNYSASSTKFKSPSKKEEKELDDLLLQRIKEIKAKIIRRRMTPLILNDEKRTEPMGETNWIPGTVPAAAQIVGMNKKFNESPSIPPLFHGKKFASYLW